MKSVALLVIAVGCSTALNEPPPVATLANGSNGRSADDLMRDGDAAWANRARPGQAETAQTFYLHAAASDEHRVDGLIGAMRAISFRIEHEPGVAKGELAKKEVDLGQWCQRRAPRDAECDYRLAIALGQFAREHSSAGMDAVRKMVDLLHRAIAAAPKLDRAGPQRVLALVLVRAPGWPVGPGDSDAGLVQARAAVTLFPDAADNQLALGEALVAAGARGEALAAYRKALALANAACAAGDPDGAGWVTRAREGITRCETR